MLPQGAGRQQSEFHDQDIEDNLQEYLNLAKDRDMHSEHDSSLPGPSTPGALGRAELGAGTQTQTQTIHGDDHDDDDYDSNYDDDEEHDRKDLRRVTMRRGKRPRQGPEPPPAGSSSLRRKPRQRHRYSLETGNGGELLLYNISSTEKLLELTCDDTTFQDSVREHPDLWIDGLRENMREIVRLRSDVKKAEEQQRVAAEDLRKSEARNAALLQDVQRANGETERLRRRRNVYQADNIALTREVEELRQQALARDQATNEDYDSNDGRSARQRRNPTAQAGVVAPVVGHTMKTRDAPIFSGDGDRETYDAWKMSIMSKIRNNPSYFIDEWRIIDYIRDSVSGTAFNLIKTRCNPSGAYPYTHHTETLGDLDNIFAIHDLIGQSYAKMNSVEMTMGYRNPKETFEEFYGRFLSCISPLHLDDRHKIEILKGKLTEVLSVRTSGLAAVKNMTFNEFCNNLKATDLDLRLYTERGAEASTRPRTARTNRTTGTLNAPAPWSKMWRKDTTTSTPRETTKATARKQEGPALPPHISTRLRKEGRCFKCLSTTHRRGDPDAPCKDMAWPSTQDMVAQLSEVDIEWDGEEYVTVDEGGPDENDYDPGNE